MKQFSGELAFLSNMEPCTINISLRGVQLTFSCVETAYQALKLVDFNDVVMFQQFNGYEAKRKIRTMPCKKQNTRQKVAIMKRLLMIKFRDETLQMKLLQTPNDQIVEINTWNDTFWGVCNGVGQDVLGKLLRSIKHGLVRDLIAENA